MNRLLNKYLIYYPVLLLTGQPLPIYLWQMRRSQWYSIVHLQQLQLRKLVKLVSYAKANIPYYRETLKKIEPESIRSLADLERIPILTKEALKEHFGELHSSNIYGAIKKTTGGSTGNPIIVFKSRAASAATYAAYWRGYGWAGIHVGDPQGRFWGVPHTRSARRLAILTDFVMNRYRCSAFAFGESDLTRYYEELNRFRPRYFYGYVSMLEEFARFLLRNNLKLEFDLEAVIATSEVLTDVQRGLMQEAFKCKVFNEYGCGEVGTIAHECEHGALHVSAERLIVETVSGGTTAMPGETGEIVVTELNNYAMPLIRYNLKDAGTLGEERCTCGRGLPIIEEVTGRAYDIIYNKKGKAFHGQYFMYVFADVESQGIRVSGFQVMQLGEEELLVKLVMVPTYKDKERVENILTLKFKTDFGETVNIKYEYTSRIERERSGKIRLVKTMLPRAGA